MFMENRPNRPLTQAELRRRAAARAKRRREIRRNRIIFAVLCIALLALVVFGATKLVQAVTGGKGNSAGSSSLASQSASATPSPSASVSGSASSQSSSSQASSSQASSSQPESTQQPDQNTTTAAHTVDSSDWLLTLINNNVALPEGWEDTLETKVAESSNGKELATVAADAYIAMKQAAAADGVELLLCSGYRSVEYQTQLFNAEQQEWLDKGYSQQEAYDKAKTEVAVPGYSEHNSGLAADIVTPKHQTLDSAFGRTDAGKWLAEHAPEYGFILRYPEGKQAITGIIYEPWHFRYVGVENAKAIAASGLCLEEYLDQNINQL